MAKFSKKDIFFKDDDMAVFGTGRDSKLFWDGTSNELCLSTTVSGVDPTQDYHLTTKQYVDDTVVSGTELQNTIYVAKNGSDVSGNGNYSNPYLTIKHANSTITGNSSDNRYVVVVGPGVYAEDNPIQMKEYVSILAIDSQVSTKVCANNTASNIIEGACRAVIGGFELQGATTAAAIYTAFSGSTHYKDITIIDCQKGLHLNHNDVEIDAYDVSLLTLSGSTTDAVLVEAGLLDIKNPHVIEDASVTSVLKVDGSNAEAHVWGLNSGSTNVTNGLYANNGGEIILFSGVLVGCTNALRANNTSNIKVYDVSVDDTTPKHILVEDLNSKIIVVAGHINREKIFFPDGYKNEAGFFLDEKDTLASVYGRFTVGRPEYSLSSTFGKGRSYTKGMKVLTTDSTASSSSDGGNITDVTTSATSVSGSTFSFQGTAANHTILISTTLSNDTDKLKAWGVRLEQTIAAVEITDKSFVTEYWNGTSWSSCTNMSTHSYDGYAYANELFIRASSSEHISCYIPSDWSKKTISGENTYWVRFRITNNLTTAPVFEQCRIQTDRFKITRNGINTFYGLSKFRDTVLATGNIFGESGGVLDSNVSIGSGGIPTGWTHTMKNNQLNGNGDAIYLQANLPRGICTACPIKIKVSGHPENSGASSDGSFIISVLPIEIQGTLEADPSGGIIPVARTLSNTKSFTTDAAQTTTVSVPFVENTKMASFESDGVDISDYYEGDMLAIRIEMDDDGTGNKDFIVWTVEISGVKWTHGERI